MWQVFCFAILWHVVTLLAAPYLGFSRDLSFSVIAYSSVDVLLSISVTIILYLSNRDYFHSFIFKIENNYVAVLERNKLILSCLVILAFSQAYLTYDLILSGAARHDLLTDYERAGPIYMLLSGFFKIITPMVLFVSSSYKLKMLMVLGLLASLMITASRSELMYVIYFYLMLLVFYKGYKKYMHLLGLVVIFAIFAVLSTKFLQNRAISDGLFALWDVGRSLVTYNAYSYYLSEIVLDKDNDFTGILYPFFGYFYEFVARFLGGTVHPVDSEFVGYLHVLGKSSLTGNYLLANVKYPWWCWFVSMFGFFGLLVKATYEYLLFAILIRLRLNATFVFLLYFLLLGVTATHPFLTLTHSVAFCVAVALDLLVRLRWSPKISSFSK